MADLSGVDCTPLFAPLGPRTRTAAEVRVRVNEFSYLPPGELDEGWLPLVREGFAALARARRCDVFCSIGCGPGVDAILAAELLGARSLILTDLRDDVVELGRANVFQNCPGFGPDDVVGATGNLCTELVARGLKADVIYENLPNLPTANLDLTEGCRRASFFHPGQLQSVPNEFSRNMLGLHYQFLTQARACLHDAGAVVCSIGLRVPVEVVLRLFEVNGFRPEILAVGGIRQFVAEEVLPHYAEIENDYPDRNPFLFFQHDKLAKALRDEDQPGRSRSDVLAAVVGRADLAMSAHDAYYAVQCGYDSHIGHLGAIIMGCPI